MPKQTAYQAPKINHFRTGPNRAEVAERLGDLTAFSDRYEDLVEVLCNAAQFGTNAKAERNYTDIRAEYLRRYASIRTMLTAFLEISPDDEASGIKLMGRPLDAFELLVAPKSIEEFLTCDDGNMISRLTRTQEAITKYRDHLRLLATRIL